MNQKVNHHTKTSGFLTETLRDFSTVRTKRRNSGFVIKSRDTVRRTYRTTDEHAVPVFGENFFVQDESLKSGAIRIRNKEGDCPSGWIRMFYTHKGKNAAHFCFQLFKLQSHRTETKKGP
jgi:hypothetical protein